jgi:hypothetical protein
MGHGHASFYKIQKRLNFAKRSISLEDFAIVLFAIVLLGWKADDAVAR